MNKLRLKPVCEKEKFKTFMIKYRKISLWLQDILVLPKKDQENLDCK